MKEKVVFAESQTVEIKTVKILADHSSGKYYKLKYL